MMLAFLGVSIKRNSFLYNMRVRSNPLFYCTFRITLRFCGYFHYLTGRLFDSIITIEFPETSKICIALPPLSQCSPSQSLARNCGAPKYFHRDWEREIHRAWSCQEFWWILIIGLYCLLQRTGLLDVFILSDN